MKLVKRSNGRTAGFMQRVRKRHEVRQAARKVHKIAIVIDATGSMARMIGQVRGHAGQLIDQILAQSGCRAEIEVIERYLPKQLSEDEAREAIAGIIEELGLSSKKELGQVMKEVKARYPGQVDGRLASSIAGQLLS